MASQAQVNGKSRVAHHPFTGATSSLGGLVHDVVALGELQIELLVEDAKETIAGVKAPVLCIVACAVSLLAALPVALFGIGYLLALTGMPVGLAILLVAVLTMGLAGVSAWLAWRKLKAATATFRRSVDEFRANVAWLKRTLSPTPVEATSHTPTSVH